MKRRDFLGICLGASFMPVAFSSELHAGKAAAAPLHLGSAINKAGRQRMLSQRMAKAYAMQVLKIMPDKADILLDHSRQLFEAQLQELKGTTPTDGIKTALGELENSWGRYRDVLGKERNRDNARLVQTESENILRVAHQVTGLYEKISGANTARLVNLSGRQRMLSQRMAKSFLLQQAGVAAGNLDLELEMARSEFVTALTELNNAKENTPEIKADLGLVNIQWLFFEQALTGKEPIREKAARNVATTSERILELMDTLTGRYESLLKA